MKAGKLIPIAAKLVGAGASGFMAYLCWAMAFYDHKFNARMAVVSAGLSLATISLVSQAAIEARDSFTTSDSE